MIQIVEATTDHAIELAPRLRHYDCITIATLGLTAQEALVSGVVTSRDTIAALVDGEVILMAGIGFASILSNSGHPWMAASDRIERHPRALAVMGRRWLAHAMSQYRQLTNMVLEEDEKARRLLVYLGFHILTDGPVTMGDVSFLRYEMTS